MVELSVMSRAWKNYLHYLNDLFNARNQIGRVESMTEELNREYNGIVLENNEWRVFFKTEQDMAFFVLKWS